MRGQFCLPLLAFVTVSAISQTRPATSARRDQLASVSECLNDPDPNTRIACMETIVASKDAARINLALQIAFRGDDPSLHALGMRTYMATAHEMSFTIQLPASVQNQYDAALLDPEKKKDFLARYPWMDFVTSRGASIHFGIVKYDSSENQGLLSTGDRRNWGKDPNFEATFVVTGDRVAATLNLGLSCVIEFRPGTDLYLKGVLSCTKTKYGPDIPKLAVYAPIL